MRTKTEIKGKQIRPTATSTRPRRSRRLNRPTIPVPTLTLAQVKKKAPEFAAKHGIDPKNIYIRGLATTGFFTIKALNKGLDKLYDTMEEYLSNRVRDTAELKEFYKKIEYQPAYYNANSATIIEKNREYKLRQMARIPIVPLDA
ncbi:hypothetical protein H257_18027 [Aphanomyces astaci]|uniref:Uncharacterized protein n=1 Tax=Aphanomyces astaci TaxID=112090 RepID=W4FER8_APHAT|nr:hypothetical protein H257_18027 [Aphanomyces astaci]ETV65213.1 hypothetical protein H257_18027 [Aphanomyces astaci]|eukprot:XP_009845337.1 hypothetical protein H257_18027 [Aphanomyces astaci]